MIATARLATQRSAFRRPLELATLPARELALAALLDAGLSFAEIGRANLADLRHGDHGQAFVRVFAGHRSPKSPLRRRFVPLDDLQRITLERYLESRRPREADAPLVLNARGRRFRSQNLSMWTRRRGFVDEGGSVR